MTRLALALVFPLVWVATAAAQGPPPVDIFVAEVRFTADELRIDSLWNATARAGYDNQPHFSDDGRQFFYSSYREGQADVYRYDLATGRSVRITDTPESEYSPTLMPGGSRLSVVRVEADSTQRLWSMRRDGSDERVVASEVRRVGYHAWLGPDLVALFIVGPPHTLHLLQAHAGRPVAQAENIGRTLARIPGTTELSYVQVDDAGQNWIVRLDTAAVSHRLVATPASDFYAWTPDGLILTTRDTVLFAFRPGRDTAWRQVADLTGYGVTGMTRLAVSPTGDRLAIVASDPPALP